MMDWKLYLIVLLRSAINETEPESPPDGLDWEKLYQLADFHSVACTAYYGIIRLPKEQQPAPEILNKFKKAMQIVLGRESMQHFEIQGVMDTFEENRIVCVPLKGWVMKDFYPRPDMRSMCDVDILVRREDMKKIPELMEKHGFKLEEKGWNHDGYMKSSILSTEIHWTLFDETSPYHEYFDTAIDKAHPLEGKQYESRMSREDFYLHVIAHMAKHFNGSGTGLRSFMDVYLFRQKVGNQLDAVYLQEELEKLHLWKFTKVVEDVADYWFAKESDRKDSQLYEEISEFVFHTGTYGTKEVEVMSGLHSKGVHKGKYLLSRFFPNIHFMQMQYPILKKVPVLLPVCWILRGFRSIFFRRKRLSAEMHSLRGADESKMKKIEDIKRMCGLT